MQLKSCSQSLPLLSSSALCPRNEQREEAQREEEKFLQGVLSQPVVPCAALQQARKKQEEKTKLKNAAVEMKSAGSLVSLSLSLPSPSSVAVSCRLSGDYPAKESVWRKAERRSEAER